MSDKSIKLTEIAIKQLSDCHKNRLTLEENIEHLNFRHNHDINSFRITSKGKIRENFPTFGANV